MGYNCVAIEKAYFGHLGQLALTNDHTRPVDNEVMGEAASVHPAREGPHISMYLCVCTNQMLQDYNITMREGNTL